MAPLVPVTRKPLISLISSSDLQLQEYGVTAVLNLSLCDGNKEVIASSGAIKPLVRALHTGTATARENAACALLRLSQVEERSGAIPLLATLLESGGFRAKKDASTALYSLYTVKENKIRAVKAGIMKVLVELMADFESNMVVQEAPSQMAPLVKISLQNRRHSEWRLLQAPFLMAPVEKITHPSK